MFVEENDKIYVIENNVVIASMAKDAYYGSCPHPECEDCGKTKYDLKRNAECDCCGSSMKITFPKKEDEKDKESSVDVGTRVSVGKKTGSVISVIPSFYGTAYGIKFDDGGIGEYELENLDVLYEERPLFSSNIQGLVHEYEQYDNMEQDTLEEITSKEKIARTLNIRAKAAATDKTLSLSDRIKIDNIVTGTAVDILDFKEAKENIQLSERDSYLNSRPKYTLSHSINRGASMGLTGDISWIDGLEHDAVENWDEVLSASANETVQNLTAEQLNDEVFMEQVVAFRTEEMASEQKERFSTFLSQARGVKLEELAVMPKEAANNDLDDIDFRSIFA